MRLSLMLTCSLLLMVGCQDSTPPSDAQKAPAPPSPAPPQGAPSKNRQPDSPIVITDANSIHYRKHNDFYMKSKTEAVAQMESGDWTLWMDGCTVSKCSIPLGKGDWTVYLKDKNDKPVAQLDYKDKHDEEYMVVKITGKGEFDPKHLPKDTAEYDPIYIGGAPGIKQKSDQVASATVGGTTLTCSAKCRIRIVREP